VNTAELTDIFEIQQLRSAYTWCLDTPDIDGLVNLFTEDAECEFGPYGLWRGHGELHAGFTEGSASADDHFLTMHITNNHVIENLDGSAATGYCYLLGQILTQHPSPDGILARYDDHYRKVEGRWLFSKVKLTFLWSSDMGRIEGGQMAEKQQSFIEARAEGES
jgi:SnoaL-like domain